MKSLLAIALLLGAAAPPTPQQGPPHPAAATAPAGWSDADAGFVAYPGPDLFFSNVEVIDGTGAPPMRGVSVLVRGGRIAAVGRISAPAGVPVIDGAGKTLLPGFVMVHEHFFYPSPKPGEYEEYPYSFSRLYLAGGTTTLRTGGSLAPYADIETARAIAAGEQPGPDMDASGPYLEGPHLLTAKMARLKDAADAARTVDFWAESGATSFKAYNYITRDELKAAIDAAHRRGLKLTGHLCSVTYDEASAMGIDNLEHSFAAATDFVKSKQPDQCPSGNEAFSALAALDPDGPEIGALMRILIDRKVALTSTLTVFETFAAGREKAPEAALALLSPQLREAYESRWNAIRSAPRGRAWAEFLPRLMRMEKRFVGMGGTLLAGTDPTGYGGVIPGWSGRRQVQLMVEAGFPFEQALKIATLNGARYLGREREIGSIAPGKRADLILVEGDPAADPRALDRMPFVFKAGVGYRTEAIFDAMRGVVGLY